MPKRASLSVTGCDFIDCGTGISVPETTELVLADSRFKRNGIAVEVRDVPSVLEVLGLPKDAPVEFVREAVAAMATVQTAPTLNRRDRFRATKLFGWLVEKGADVSSIVVNVAAIAAHPNFRSIVDALSG